MRNARKKKRLWALLIPFAILLSAGALWTYSYLSLNLWISDDAGILHPYSRTLIVDEQPAWIKNPAPDEPTRQIEEALVLSNAKDRIVLNLSRSEIRYNFSKKKAYVKVYLRTAFPSDRAKTASIKILNTLIWIKDHWKVQTTQDISIE